MQIIRIPKGKNKLNFVYNVLHAFIDLFKEYVFINCTSSPLEEYAYFDCNGIKCRQMKIIQLDKLANEESYLQSFVADGLSKQGYSLRQYIDTCHLFELETIKVLDGIFYKENCEKICGAVVIATIEICPDGLDEIHIAGDVEFLNRTCNIFN